MEWIKNKLNELFPNDYSLDEYLDYSNCLDTKVNSAVKDIFDIFVKNKFTFIEAERVLQVTADKLQSKQRNLLIPNL